MGFFEKKHFGTKNQKIPGKNSILNKSSQPTHYCKMVQEMKPYAYGSLASANKFRWKSRGWKESRSPEPSSNVPMRCPSPACKVVFWKRYLYEHISQKHTNLTMTPTIASIAMYPHKKEIMSRVSSRIREKCWPLSVPRMTRTHTTDCAL